MSRTTRRGKAERDHARDKRVGTGSYKLINKSNNFKKPKKLKRKIYMARAKVTTSDISNTITLNPSEGTELIVGLYQANAFERTPMFRGAPGIGKTSFVKAAYEKLREIYPDFGYVEINPTMPADEVGGIPDLIRKEGEPTTTDYALPAWFPRDPNSRGILCLDDMAQGDKMMQTTLANLIQAKNLRTHPLPKGWMIVGTGNRAEDNAGSNKLLTHLGDRLTMFTIEADPQAWINDYALPNGVDERIIAFIQQYPHKLNQFDPKQEKCATSRTWTAVSSRMAYIDSLKDTPHYEKFAQAILAGELGMGEACVFWAYCKLWGNTPDIDNILANPTTASIDYDIDIKYATATSIAKRMDISNMANALTYIERIDADLLPMVVKLGLRNTPALKDTETFEGWCMKNQELVHGALN